MAAMEATQSSVITFFTPKELEKMARREYQDPPLLRTNGAHPRWYIRIRKRFISADGPKRKQTREYLGFVKDVSVRDAQRARTAKLAEINGQIYKLPSQILLNEFFLIYNEKFIPTLRHSTQKKYRIHATNHILPEFGALPLCEITTERLQHFFNRKVVACGTCATCRSKSPGCKGLSWWTRNDIKQVMLSIFKLASDWDYWKERNPVDKVKLGEKIARREQRILTPTQINALLCELPTDVELMVRLGDSTGMRISEILGLRWKNVDLDRGWVFVREACVRGIMGPPKTKTSKRDLPLGELRADLVDRFNASARPNVERLVFCDYEGNPLDDRDLNQHHLRKAAKRLGFYWKGFGFHSFRRGQITGIQEIGGSSIEAQKMAGHSGQRMTADYTIVQEQRKEELVRARQSRLMLVKSKKTGAA